MGVEFPVVVLPEILPRAVAAHQMFNNKGGDTERSNAEQFFHAAGEKMLDLGGVFLISWGFPRQLL